MKASREKLKEIFAAAADTDAADRPAFLAEACGADAELLWEVGSLLDSDGRAVGFMEGTAVAEVADEIAATPRLEKGTLLGEYRVGQMIGSGGTGEIYLAVDRRLDRKVALKLLPSGDLDSAAKFNRFLHEARIVSSLNHPSILTVHDVGTYEGGNFIVSEYVEGVTLREMMETGSPTASDAVSIAMQIASALSSAHAAGVIHRDIKPENVMVRRDGMVKVLDFGIAKLSGEGSALKDLAGRGDKNKTAQGTIVGTVNYMSPEQARGKTVDPRSDIFSLGVVVYEMLAGRRPFEGETQVDTISNILYKDPEPIRFEGGGWNTIARMLAKDRKARFRSMDEALGALKELARDLDGGDRQPLKTGNLQQRTESSYIPAKTGEAAANGTTRVHRPTLPRIGVFAAAALIIFGLGGTWYWLAARGSADADGINAIAVMPIVNVTGQVEPDFLADGITDALIGALARVPGLKVKARSSVFRYQGKDTDVRTLGSELGVQAILNGRVSGREDEIVLNVELVDTRTETVIWSANYRRRPADLMLLESEIARDVSRHLRPALSNAEGQSVEKRQTENYEAYQHYVKGRFFWNKRTGADMTRAVAEFEKAVEKDPNFALAYVGLADSYSLLEQYVGTPSSETLPKAETYAARALEIDDTLAEAHASMGFVRYAKWDWEESDRQFRRAIELNPNYSTAHHMYYVLLRDTGRMEEALEHIRIARELDPLSLVINVSYARGHLLNGDSAAGIDLAKKLIDLYPNYAPNYATLGMAYMKEGKNAEGLAELKRASALDQAGAVLSPLGWAYAMTGNRREAAGIARELEARYARREVLGRQVAAVYVGLGDLDAAFAWLEKDFDARSTEISSITSMQEFDTIRSDPRYTDLLRRMGLLV